MTAPGAEQAVLEDPAALAPLSGFWEYWGFEPWHRPPLAGVSRRQRFVKSGILGKVAEYHAWECIVWDCGEQRDREGLWKSCAPMPDVLTQRFLFLRPDPVPGRRVRSFLLGFAGYLEFYEYWPGLGAEEKVRDLTGLVDLGLGLLQKEGYGAANT
jgi:hypothetical protein